MTKEQNMFKYTPQAEPKIASHWSVLVGRKNWFWPVFRMERSERGSRVYFSRHNSKFPRFGREQENSEN